MGLPRSALTDPATGEEGPGCCTRQAPSPVTTPFGGENRAAAGDQTAPGMLEVQQKQPTWPAAATLTLTALVTALAGLRFSCLEL